MPSVPNQGPTVLSTDGAIALPGGSLAVFHVTKSTAAALTLVAPDRDGQRVVIIDESAHAHTVVVGVVSPPSGLNGGASTTLTFNGTRGSSCELFGRNGSWWAGLLTGVALS